LLLATLALLPATSAAQDREPLWERGSLDVGIYFSDFDADLRVDLGAVSEGSAIDLSDDLGLATEEDAFQARLAGRFGRHQISLGWYQLEAESEGVVLDRTIEFEGRVFPVNALLSSRLETRNLELSYTAWVVQRPRFGLGLSAGVVAFRIGASLDAEVELFGVTDRILEEADAEVPVPSIGLEGRALLHPRVLLLGHVRHLPSIEIDEFEGQSTSAGIGIEGRVARALRVGVAYEVFELDVELDESEFDGSVDWSAGGPRLYARLIW
jgi:hypothetical protein